jgi:hypothetical protein
MYFLQLTTVDFPDYVPFCAFCCFKFLPFCTLCRLVRQPSDAFCHLVRLPFCAFCRFVRLPLCFIPFCAPAVLCVCRFVISVLYLHPFFIIPNLTFILIIIVSVIYKRIQFDAEWLALAIIISSLLIW